MIGYLAYVLLLFLPGLSLGLLLDLWKGKRFIEVLSIAFGLSLVVVPLLLLGSYALIRTISSIEVYGIVLVAGVASIILGISRKQRLVLPRISRAEAAVLLASGIQGVIFLAQLSKYPIFPVLNSQDFQYHLQTAVQFQSGQVSLASLTYPPGVHQLIAALLAVEGGNPISELQYAMLIMGTIAPLLLFTAVSKVLGDEKLGLVASLIFVFSGSFWYSALFSSGIYANYFGDLITLVVVYLVVGGMERLDVRRSVLILLAGAMLYLSHFSTLVFVAILWLALPIVWLRAREKLSRWVQIAAIITAPGVLVALAKPSLVAATLALLNPSQIGGQTAIFAPDALTNFLASTSPFLEFLYVSTGPALFFLSLLALPASLYAAWKKPGIWVPLCLAWFLIIWVAAPGGTTTWRFSKYALLPLTFLWPATLKAGLPQLFTTTSRKQVARKQRAGRGSIPGTKLAAIIIISAVLVYATPFYSMVNDVQNSPNEYNQNQTQVYDAMLWVETNGGPHAPVLVLDDYQPTYMTGAWGNPVDFYLNASADGAYQLATTHGYQYVMVSAYYVPGPFATVLSTNPYAPLFQNNSDFRQVYSNPSFSVYVPIKPTG